MVFYDKNIGKMLDRDVAYAPVAPNWINFYIIRYNITVEGCLL